jgi:hypothetical protein
MKILALKTTSGDYFKAHKDGVEGITHKPSQFGFERVFIVEHKHRGGDADRVVTLIPPHAVESIKAVVGIP